MQRVQNVCRERAARPRLRARSVACSKFHGAVGTRERIRWGLSVAVPSILRIARDVDPTAVAGFAAAGDRPAVVQRRQTLRRRERGRRPRSGASGLGKCANRSRVSVRLIMRVLHFSAFIPAGARAGAGLRAHSDRQDGERRKLT